MASSAVRAPPRTHATASTAMSLLPQKFRASATLRLRVEEMIAAGPYDAAASLTLAATASPAASAVVFVAASDGEQDRLAHQF